MPQLYKWIACKEEPLASYAIGLLALAMELNEVATITIVITDQYDCASKSCIRIASEGS